MKYNGIRNRFHQVSVESTYTILLRSYHQRAMEISSTVDHPCYAKKNLLSVHF